MSSQQKARRFAFGKTNPTQHNNSRLPVVVVPTEEPARAADNLLLLLLRVGGEVSAALEQWQRLAT